MIVNSFSQLSGLNTNLSPFLQPPDSMTIANGVTSSYKLGALIKDVGYSQVGDTIEASKSVTGLFDFKQSPSVQKILATINNSAGTNLVLAYNNAGTWTDISLSSAWDGFEDCKVEMESFIGHCFFVGYDDTDSVFLPVGSLTGTTFSTSANVTSMPQAKYIVRYRDRVYIANCRYSGANHEYRVYFSSVPSAGAITWTPASDFLDVDYGEELTGMGTNWDRLVAFTENRGWMYDQSSWKQVWNTGCSNHRTIQNHGPYMIWCDYDGVWMSTGGQPQNISGPVIDFIRNGSPTGFFSVVVDEEYRMYVGTVTVNDKTYTNCELIFNIPTSTWRTREYFDNFTAYAPYNKSGKIVQYMGDDSGEVMEKAKHTDSTLISADDGNDISVDFELAPMLLSHSLKGVKELLAYASNAQGLVLKYRIIDSKSRSNTPYRKLGELTKYINTFDTSSADPGVLLQVAGSESGQQEFFEFYGYAIDIIEKSKTYASAQK